MAESGKHGHDVHPEEEDTERLYELPDDVKETANRRGGDYFYREGELLVAKGDEHLVQETLRKLKAEADPKASRRDIVRYLLPEGEAVENVVDELRAVSAGYGRAPVVGPNHVLFGSSHMLFGPATLPSPAKERPRLPEGKGLPGEGVRVGVVDTGIFDHEWLIDRYEAGPGDADVLPTSGPLDPQTGHGTFIAGVVLLHAPGATVVVRRAAGSSGATDDLTVAAAIDDLPKVHILCLSVGGYSHDGMDLPATTAALARLRKRSPRTVVVAAAGNNRTDRPFLPAALKHVIAVAALDERATTRADFSNFGPWVDACAPGTDVHSCFVPGEWAHWSGTSFAAPRVAGAIAAAASSGVDVVDAAYQLIGASGLSQLDDLGTVVNPPEVV
jgi:subtilisin family serine protease